MKHLLTRFTKDQSGGPTAIEFMVLAVPFFTIMLGFFEIMMIFLTEAELENAIAKAQRQLILGNAQSQASSTTTVAALLRQSICGSTSLNCEDLTIDIRDVDLDSLAGLSEPVYDPTANSGAGGFTGQEDDTRSGGDQIVMLRFYYLRDFFTPLTGPFFKNHDPTPDRRLYVTSRLFRTTNF